MTNLSRPVKFVPGTLVSYNGYIWEVDHNSEADVCHIKRGHNKTGYITMVRESAIRALYWYEFAFHRDPMKGHWMIGKNRALPLLYGFAVLLAGTVASLKSVEGAWKWACPAILAMFLTGTIIGTVRNSKSKQF